MKTRFICALTITLILLALLCGCKSSGKYILDDGSKLSLNGSKINYKIKKENGKMVSENAENVKVKFEMESGDVFVAELYPEYAPITVRNFLDLVDEGFYDGLTFHRVIPGFMAQGGDPEGTGMGGSGENIKGEFAENGYSSNTIKHERGVISMARAMDPDSASSQFFICFEAANYLDGSYAAFGKVVYNMEAVDAIADIPTDANDKPLTKVAMKEVSIITDDEYQKISDSKN